MKKKVLGYFLCLVGLILIGFNSQLTGAVIGGNIGTSLGFILGLVFVVGGIGILTKGSLEEKISEEEDEEPQSIFTKFKNANKKITPEIYSEFLKDRTYENSSPLFEDAYKHDRDSYLTFGEEYIQERVKELEKDKERLEDIKRIITTPDLKISKQAENRYENENFVSKHKEEYLEAIRRILKDPEEMQKVKGIGEFKIYPHKNSPIRIAWKYDSKTNRVDIFDFRYHKGTNRRPNAYDGNWDVLVDQGKITSKDYTGFKNFEAA